MNRGARGNINRDLAGGYGSYMDMGNSIFSRLVGVIKRRGIRLPNLSLASIATIFSNAGHNVEYKTDTNFDADLVLVASSIVGFAEEIKAISEIKKSKSLKIGSIGAFCSAMSEPYLEVSDFVIKGEPEEASKRIADGLDPEGIIESEALKDLDSLPYPKWDLFPIGSYSYSPVLRKKPFTTIETSRGCPFSCHHYCPYTAHQGRTFRYRSTDNVMGEIEYLTSRFNVKALLFRDPVFSLRKDRALELAENLVKANLDLQWACETHLSTLDEKSIDLFYRAGLRHINTGIENVDEDVLKKTKRHTTKKTRQEELIQYCERKGIGISAFYILGSLHDTKDTIRNVIRYAKYLNTSFAQFSLSTPYPGTPYFSEMEDRLLNRQWDNYSGFDPVFQHPTISPQEMTALRNEAYKSYYFSLRWGWKFLNRLSAGR